MASLNSIEEYKAAYREASARASDLSAELERVRREFKRIDAAEKASAEAVAAKDAAEELLRATQAELAAVKSDRDAARSNERLLADKAARYDAIRGALS